MIRYYSTNRRLDGVAGLTPFKGQVSFRDALIQGQAPDEGLFMPEPIPRLSIDDILGAQGGPLCPGRAPRGAGVPGRGTVPRRAQADRRGLLQLRRPPGAGLRAHVRHASRPGAHGLLQGFCRPDDGEAHEPPARPGKAAQRARGHLGRHGKRRRRGLQGRRGDQRLDPLPAKRSQRDAEEAARHDRRQRPGPVRGRQVRRLPEPGEAGLLRPGAFAVST